MKEGKVSDHQGKRETFTELIMILQKHVPGDICYLWYMGLV